jgi:hypothetical protein
MSRTIFNELGETRVINPRSGFSQFVDLSNNQIISGIKRFLNNLITNSDVNFNTTANVGRIVFHPNEPVGSGDIIMAVYTENENVTTGWKFDSYGNLYYFGIGQQPYKILFFADGNITIIGDFIALGNIKSDTYGSSSNGDITFINNIALGNNNISTTGIIGAGAITCTSLNADSGSISTTGTIGGGAITCTSLNVSGGNITNTGSISCTSLNAGSGTISTTGTISCLDISSNGMIYAKDVNLQPSGYLNVNNITSCQSTGLYPTKIALSNEFIDVDNSSLDIIAQYIGFGNPQQTLTTASKYMYIKPLSTGDFEIRINNITNKVLATDWSQLATATQMTSNWYSTSGILMGFINPNPGAGNNPVMRIMGTPNQYIYYNTFNNFGNYNSTTSVVNWEIFNNGNFVTLGTISATTITGTSLNAGSGTISTTGNISGALISCTSLNAGSGTISTSGNISGALITGTSLSAGSGTISTTGNISGALITGTSLSAGSGTISTTGNISGALITGTSLSAGSGTISTTGNMSCLNMTSTGSIYGLNIDLQETGFILTNRIYSKTTSGSYTTSINLSNEFIDTGNSSLDIVAQYIGFPNPQQTLTTASKYMYIKPLSTGNFEMIISNITNKILSSDWATTKMASQYIWNFNNASNITNITLDATTTSGDRLIIYGVASGTKYLYYNTSNNIGVYNTSTGTSVWSIDGTTGNIVTIGSYTVGTLSATSFLCNSMSPLSGTVINIGVTSEFNWLKSAGVYRVKLFPTSTSGDIMLIARVSDAALSSGYWYFNNTGNFGYITGGVAVWQFQTTGGLVLRGTLQMALGSIILSDTYSANSTTDGGAYMNTIKMNTLFTSSTIGSIELSSRYINFVNPYQTLSASSKYMFIYPDTGGNFTQYINNIAGRVLQTDWATLGLRTDYNFQTFGNYIYSQHSSNGDRCGLWSNRIFGSTGGGLYQNGNNWVCLGGLENNNNANIGSGFNNGGQNRVFTWMIENTVNSGKALGLAVNRVNAPNANINASTQSTGFALLGYYDTSRGGTAYSFTGEHSSMICDEEYDDIMDYNTDDFLGLVVCSSGKIYNLPYDVDGNTYTKQVDNIKSVDSQPMTRLSKKYKDKSVLGVISHIERVGKDRNDLNGTSWTGCMALDKDERRRIRVACIGEGGIWITNEYGNIENGDYITTSKIAGYSTKQDSDFLMNYTIAKSTMDCDFDIEKPDEYKTKYLGDGIYASYISCTFHCG